MAERVWETVPSADRKWEASPSAIRRKPVRVSRDAKPESTGFRDKDEGGLTEFLRGMGLSAAKTGVGALDLMSDYLPESMQIDPMAKKALELWEKDIQEGSGWGDAGGIVGDIAQFAAPGAAAFKGAKALGGGLKSIMAGEAVVGGLLGGTRMPLNDETRTGNALFDAGVGALGVGAGKVVGKGLEKTMKALSMKRSAAGQKMMDLSPDYNFSPASVLESNPVKNLQHLMENLPIVARRTRKVAARDLEQYNLASLKSISDNPSKITEAGNKGFKVLNDQFTDGYNKAWKGAGEVPDDLTSTLWQQMDTLTKDKPFLVDEMISLPGDMKEISALNSILNKADSLHLENTPNGLKSLDSEFKRLINKSDPKDQMDLRDVLKELRATVRDFIPDQKNAAKLNSLDERFPSLLALDDATSSATRNQEEGIWQAKQLLAGTEKRARGRGEFSSGGGPMREMADMGGRAFKPADVESQPSIMNWVMRLGKAIPGGSLTPMKTVSNIMTGQTKLGKGGKIENVATPAALIALLKKEKEKRAKK